MPAFPATKAKQSASGEHAWQAGNRGTRENCLGCNNRVLDKQAEFDAPRPADMTASKHVRSFQKRIPDPRLLRNSTVSAHPLRPVNSRSAVAASPVPPADRPTSRNRPYDDTPETHPCTFIPAHQTRHSGLPLRGGRIGTETRDGAERARVRVRALARTNAHAIFDIALSQRGITTGRISAWFNLRIYMGYGDSKHTFRADCLTLLSLLLRPNT